MADYASESGHFYTRAGEPAYEVTRSDGKGMRQTTLRDARKLDLLPGATTVMRECAKPGLERYFQKGIFKATRDTMVEMGEITGPVNEEEWFTEVLRRAKDAGKQASDRGTEIHGALERSRKGLDVGMEFVPWVEAVSLEIEKACGLQLWRSERSYAHKYGYGCRIDLHSGDPNPWVIDYKGKDDDKRDDLVLFDEHYQQLAACRLAAGLPHARCAIVFFGRTTPWAKFIEAEEEELKRGWDCFEALLSYYQSKNRLYRE